MARVMTPEEYQDFINEALTIAQRGLDLPGGVKVYIEPRIKVDIPEEFSKNPERVEIYKKFVDELNIVMNAMELQIHMIAGSTAAAPDAPPFGQNFPIGWFQEYRKWFDEVVKPVRKSIEDIEAAQNAQREEELAKVKQALSGQASQTVGGSATSDAGTDQRNDTSASS